MSLQNCIELCLNGRKKLDNDYLAVIVLLSCRNGGACICRRITKNSVRKFGENFPKLGDVTSASQQEHRTRYSSRARDNFLSREILLLLKALDVVISISSKLFSRSLSPDDINHYRYNVGVSSGIVARTIVT